MTPAGADLRVAKSYTFRAQRDGLLGNWAEKLYFLRMTPAGADLRVAKSYTFRPQRDGLLDTGPKSYTSCAFCAASSRWRAPQW